MTLASKLMEISKSQGTEQAELIDEFSQWIEGHKEEKTLRDCLIQAQLHRQFLDFGRNMFMPTTLQDEGFQMKMAGPGFHLHFDKE